MIGWVKKTKPGTCKVCGKTWAAGGVQKVHCGPNCRKIAFRKRKAKRKIRKELEAAR